MSPSVGPNFGQGLLRYAGVGLGATASHYALMAALVEWLEGKDG